MTQNMPETYTAVPEPGPSNDYLADHAVRLLASHRRLTGRDLLPTEESLAEAARALYHAPFVVLSHDRADDPRFTYANLAAQRVFAMPWPEIVGMPSRYSAEAPNRDERQRLLDTVARDGYIDDYQGVRIARTGERFLIRRATVWNLIDAAGAVHGQAATFADWTPLGATGA
jgi:hypothetical protein